MSAAMLRRSPLPSYCLWVSCIITRSPPRLLPPLIILLASLPATPPDLSISFAQRVQTWARPVHLDLLFLCLTQNTTIPIALINHCHKVSHHLHIHIYFAPLTKKVRSPPFSSPFPLPFTPKAFVENQENSPTAHSLNQPRPHSSSSAPRCPLRLFP
jgi:hypothetical protein